MYHSSKRDDWLTPPSLLEKVREFNQGKQIGLDPCPAKQSFVKAKTKFFYPRKDGLQLSWTGYGLVFVNPPYGRGAAIRPWVQWTVEQASVGAPIIFLCPARVGTIWWQDNIVGAYNAVCFLRGRQTFYLPETMEPVLDLKTGKPSPAGFPSALVYFGKKITRFHQVFKSEGWVI